MSKRRKNFTVREDAILTDAARGHLTKAEARKRLHKMVTPKQKRKA